MNLAKSIAEVLENNDINIICTEKQDGEYYTEMEFYSDAGEDFVFSIWHSRTKKSFIDAFRDYAIDFDPDEHAEMWVNARNTVNGVPQSIQALIDDADSIDSFLNEVSEQLYKVA
jgi:hypothetical protein